MYVLILQCITWYLSSDERSDDSDRASSRQSYQNRAEKSLSSLDWTIRMSQPCNTNQDLRSRRSSSPQFWMTYCSPIYAKNAPLIPKSIELYKERAASSIATAIGIVIPNRFKLCFFCIFMITQMYLVMRGLGYARRGPPSKQPIRFIGWSVSHAMKYQVEPGNIV